MSGELEFVTVGESKYRVIKTGRAQAEQVVGITRWLSVHGTKALTKAQETQAPSGESGIQTFIRFLGVLDTDAVIDLFIVMTGCTKEEAEVYFDVATLVDVAIEVYNRNTSLRRLIDRFFSPTSSVEPMEEPSTTSE